MDTHRPKRNFKYSLPLVCSLDFCSHSFFTRRWRGVRTFKVGNEAVRFAHYCVYFNPRIISFLLFVSFLFYCLNSLFHLPSRRPLSYPETDVFLVCLNLVSYHAFDRLETLWVPEVGAKSEELWRGNSIYASLSFALRLPIKIVSFFLGPPIFFFSSPPLFLLPGNFFPLFFITNSPLLDHSLLDFSPCARRSVHHCRLQAGLARRQRNARSAGRARAFGYKHGGRDRWGHPVLESVSGHCVM